MVKIIEVQQIPQRARRKVTSADRIAQFCFYYQQYTYKQASQLPEKRIRQMLRVAEREYAKKMFDLLQIAVAPFTKKGSGAKDLSDYWKGILED